MHLHDLKEQDITYQEFPDPHQLREKSSLSSYLNECPRSAYDLSHLVTQFQSELPYVLACKNHEDKASDCEIVTNSLCHRYELVLNPTNYDYLGKEQVINLNKQKHLQQNKS